MALVELQNPHLRVVVDPDHGAEITHLENAGGTNMLAAYDWETPIPASRSRSYGSDVLDWLSEYRGGWQELFPNGGAGGTVMGTPLPFHGEVSRARWSVEWLETRRAVRLRTGTRLPIVLERVMRLDADRPILFIEETISNESDQTVPYIWGHHPAFAPPLTAPGAKIDLPPGVVVTADSGLDGDFVDVVPGSRHRWSEGVDKQGNALDLAYIPDAPLQRLLYITELAEGWAAIRHPAHGLGVALAWSLTDFPALWLWQEIGGTGMPWHGRARITALEPQSQTPAHGLAAAVEAGTARTLAPHASATTWLTCSLFTADTRPVRHAAQNGAVLFEE